MTTLSELDVERNLQNTIDTLRKAVTEVEHDLESNGGKLSAPGQEVLKMLAGKLAEAETYFARALDSKELYDSLAEVAKKVGDKAGAAHYTKQGNTFLADELEFKGRLHAFYGNNTVALKHFREALALVEDHEFSLKGAAAAAKRVEKAQKDLGKHKSNAQGRGEAKDWLEYGKALADLGRMEDASATYEKALATDAKNPDAMARKGTSLHAQGKPEEALTWYKRALEVKPTSMTGRRGVNYATYQIEHPEG